MKTSRTENLMAAALAGSLFSGPALAQHWSYEGDSAPENWGKLDPKFVMCAIGKNQSPIDLHGFVEARLDPLKLNYSAGAADIRNHGHVPAAGAAEILNNGHTVQVNYAPGSAIIVDARAFELQHSTFIRPAKTESAASRSRSRLIWSTPTRPATWR